MKKPAGIVDQVWESRVLRDKAHEAHKAYDKAQEHHEKAEQACRDIPRLDTESLLDGDQRSIDAYNHAQDTRRTMNEACEVMAEAYCDYVNHKRNIRIKK